ncbi:IMP3 protein, partial [Polyodon spathula]|nr:IMP3 protein [Polyodon spathula]
MVCEGDQRPRPSLREWLCSADAALRAGFENASLLLAGRDVYTVGLIPTRENLVLTEKVSASSFCRRRLPTIMVKLRMAQNLKTAITFIEQGRILHWPL